MRNTDSYLPFGYQKKVGAEGRYNLPQTYPRPTLHPTLDLPHTYYLYKYRGYLPHRGTPIYRARVGRYLKGIINDING